MKLFTLLTVCLFAFTATKLQADTAPKAVKQESGKINWVTDIEKAKSDAKQKKVPIFLYFSGSDWCPHCKKMDREILSSADFQQLVQDKVIFVHVDFPHTKKLDEKTAKQNHDLKKQFGISGFPTVLLVDANLKLITKVSRKPEPKAFAQELLSHLKK